MRLATVLFFGLSVARVSATPAVITTIATGRALPAQTETDAAAEPTASEVSVAKLAKQLASDDLQQRREAVWALARVGDDAALALPELIEAADHRDAQLGNGALQALGTIGPDAAEALPVIVDQLDERNQQRRYRAAFALGNIATEGAAEINEGLADDSERVRAATAEAVGWMRQRATSHVATLIELLEDENESVSQAAARALRRLETIAVPELSRALNDEGNEPIRQRCATVLGEIGPPAMEARQSLQTLAQSPSAELRAAAITALARIARSSKADSAVAKLVADGLSDESTEVRQAAIAAVMRMPGVQGRDAVVEPLLTSLDGDPRTAKLAAFAIGRLGANAASAVPELLKRIPIRTTGQSQTTPIHISLSHLGSVAIPGIVGACREDRLDVKQGATIIAAMGPRALPEVRNLLAAPSATERALGLRCIGQLAPTPEALESLRQGLGDSTARVREAAAVGFQHLGAAGRSAEEELAELVTDTDAAVRGAALASLTTMGMDEDQATPLILTALNDNSATVRRLAAKSVGNLSEINSELILAVADALDDVDAAVQLAAAETLADQPKLAAELIDQLLVPLSQSRVSPELTEALVTAIGRLEHVGPAALEAVADCLDSQQIRLQLAALKTAERIGKAAQPLHDAVDQIRKNGRANQRSAAIAALASMADSVDQRISLLTGALDDDDWVVRRETAELLADMGRKAKPAVPRLIRLMREGDDQSSEAAKSALRRIDAAPAEAVPLLVEILEDDDSSRRERFYALHLLRKAGADARPALPTLKRLRDEADGRIEGYLNRAIRDIENDSRDD